MAVVLYQNNTSPSVTDVISVNGTAEDLTGATVSFRARDPRLSTTVIDNSANVTLLNQTTTPGGVQWDPQASETATAYVSPPLVGWWHIVLAGGHVQDTPEFPVYILPHAEVSSSDLCTLNDFREISQIPISDRKRDQLVQNMIPIASDAITRYSRREFAPVAGTVTLRFQVDNLTVNLDPHDLRSVSSVSLNPESSAPITITSPTQYTLEPVGAPWGTYQYLRLSRTNLSWYSTTLINYGYALVDIAGQWGFGTVPPAVKMACVRTIESWVDRAQAAYGVQDFADDPRGVAPAYESAYGIPPGARRLLAPFCRTVITPK